MCIRDRSKDDHNVAYVIKKGTSATNWITLKDATKTVSYTHLDVYKRQLLTVLSATTSLMLKLTVAS